MPTAASPRYRACRRYLGSPVYSYRVERPVEALVPHQRLMKLRGQGPRGPHRAAFNVSVAPPRYEFKLEGL